MLVHYYYMKLQHYDIMVNALLLVVAITWETFICWFGSFFVEALSHHCHCGHQNPIVCLFNRTTMSKLKLHKR